MKKFTQNGYLYIYNILVIETIGSIGIKGSVSLMAILLFRLWIRVNIVVTLFKIINFYIDCIDKYWYFLLKSTNFFFNFDFEFRKHDQENMFLLLESWRYIEFLYLLYFDRVVSNMHPSYGNSFLL
jgi:hypothetical protein